jgi:hypothetical protein
VFAVIRESGKCNAQVILDLVADALPGTLFTYDQLRAALSEGTNTEYDKAAVQAAVRSANRRLLREYRRYLGTVRNAGYHIIAPGDHQHVATWRNRRAERQEKWALDTLRYARTEDMTNDERERHVAMLTILEGVVAYKRAQERRTARLDELVAGLTHRVEQLEGRDG